eukprot:SAG31_NODE_2631_length_5350_cov_1.613026_2_plen_382_part_00
MEEAARIAGEEEAARVAAEEEAARVAAEEEAARVAAADEAEVAQIAEEEVARIAAVEEEEAARVVAEEEVARVAVAAQAEDEVEVQDDLHVQTLTIVCPDDAVPGSVILVATDDGRDIEVGVPDGVVPGDEFIVSVELSPGQRNEDEEIASAENQMSGNDDALDPKQTQILTIICPDGTGPGCVIAISTDWGTELEVEVPDGITAGDEFTVELEAPVGFQAEEPDELSSSVLEAEEEALRKEMAALEAEEHSLALELGNEHAHELLAEAEKESLQSLNIICPEGSAAGSVILITTDWGTELEVEVPPGIEAGDEFTVSVEVSELNEGPPADADNAQALGVECPDGCEPGDAILVTAADGRELEVVVPDGVGPGMVFEVFID